MALTEDLNIYRSMYNLLRLLIQARNNFDKPYKYVVGDRIVDTALFTSSALRQREAHVIAHARHVAIGIASARSSGAVPRSVAVPATT